ncbi:hypothetical protein MPH_03410 [Macrophomina phaseolina MS6]|uniref:Uncharacterized protein n=1 Tax=Macrophomina phaseolina (strain MS6) TaxID=1126212 RepID=K2RAQ7_MACPH|nr:hypothetical protein MPH_03410 [Macrophomina phaseolina MS6]
MFLKNKSPRRQARDDRYEEKFGVRSDLSPTPISRSGNEKPMLTAASTEHVLRPAASNSSLGLRGSTSMPAFRGRLDGGRSSSTTANHLLAAPSSGNVNTGGSTPSNAWKKPSPTPSLKRDKVQKLIKEHGSPPGLRVTAGGRIVPQDMPCLGSPQYPINNGPKIGEWSLRGTPGLAMQRATSQPPFVRRSSDVFPSSNFEPMSRSNSSNTAVNTTIPAYTPGVNSSFMPFFFPGAPFVYPQAPPRPFNAPLPAPNKTNSTARADVAELRKMLEKIHVEQRDLEREMVIRENTLTPEERQTMVEQKVQMVNESDRIRKDIKRIESGESSGGGSSEQQRPVCPPPPGFLAAQSGPHAALSPYMFAAGTNGFMPFVPGSQFPGPYVLPNIMPFSGFTALDGASGTPSGEGVTSASDDVKKAPEEEKNNPEEQELHEPSSKPATHVPRRSHALEIKDPNKALEQKSNRKRSALDPTSPAYTPQKKTKSDASREDSSLVFVPPSPSPIASPRRDAAFAAHFPWLCSDSKEDKRSEAAIKISPEPSDRSSAHRPSASSINTADFFPNNPHEHSSTSFNFGRNVHAHHVTPERAQIAWTSVFQSPDENNNLLRAPQVSPVDGPSLRSDSALSTHASEISSRNGRLHVPQSSSRQRCEDKVSSSGGRPWPKAEAIREHPPASRSTGQLDYKDKSIDFILGFSAGLTGKPIQGSETVDFMQGWAEGLLRAKTSNSAQASAQSDSSVSADRRSTSPRRYSSQHRSSFLNPDSVRSRREEDPPFSIGYMQLTSTAMHRASLATLKAAPVTQETRPVAARFETSDTTKSISSSMDIGPANVPSSYRTVSAETDKTITGRIDAVMITHQAPMTSHSGNERDETRPSDRVSQSPSKLNRVFSGQSMPGQSQQKANRSFNLNCLGDQREQARHTRASYDGTEDEPGENPMADTMNARVSPSKGSAFTDSPSVSTGSPKKLSKAAVKNKFEEVAGNVGGGVKSRKGRKQRKNGHEEADDTVKDPAKMSRDEKKNWRELWKKRFEDIRNEEQREIDRYRMENPPHR